MDQQRYRVIEKLDAGGMAEVYKAESEGLEGFHKQVAIKRVLPHLSEKTKFISMFLDEARLSARLTHSNCVQVFDIGVGDHAYFIVMEFVDGSNLKSLAETLKNQGKVISVQIAAFIAIEICKGLSYAHELKDAQGQSLDIVHRDMSPPNVLITKHGEVKIVDFGLAKASSQLEKSEPGIIKGKFAYLSPEAAMGQEVDLRADIFAVGIILWELLAGERLFLGATDIETVKNVQDAAVPSISQKNGRVPLGLERILSKALAKDRDKRYMSAKQLGQDLTRFIFEYGRPVGTFDLADLITSTVLETKKMRPPQASIIDKLIEEALFEFTSLKNEEHADSSFSIRRESSRPPDGAKDLVDPTAWASELHLPASQYQREQSIRAHLKDFQLGHLSSLEEDRVSSFSSQPPKSFLPEKPTTSSSKPSPPAPKPPAPSFSPSAPLEKVKFTPPADENGALVEKKNQAIPLTTKTLDSSLSTLRLPEKKVPNLSSPRVPKKKDAKGNSIGLWVIFILLSLMAGVLSAFVFSHR